MLFPRTAPRVALALILAFFFRTPSVAQDEKGREAYCASRSSGQRRTSSCRRARDSGLAAALDLAQDIAAVAKPPCSGRHHLASVSPTYRGRQMMTPVTDRLDYSVLGTTSSTSARIPARANEGSISRARANGIDKRRQSSATRRLVCASSVGVRSAVRIGCRRRILLRPRPPTRSAPRVDGKRLSRRFMRRAHTIVALHTSPFPRQGTRALRRGHRRHHRRPRAHALAVVFRGRPHFQDDGGRAGDGAHRSPSQPREREGRVDRLENHHRRQNGRRRPAVRRGHAEIRRAT